jgi:hypothetical protein
MNTFTKVNQVRPLVEEIFPKIENMHEELLKYKFGRIEIQKQYYKAKTAFYDKNDILRYCIMAFKTQQEYFMFLSNLQKGLARIYVDYTKCSTVANGYIGRRMTVQNENTGDGVPAIIYCDDNNVLRVHKGESKVDIVFNWVDRHAKCGLLPEWKDYIFNEFSTRGLIHSCKGFDYSGGKAPEVLVLDYELDKRLEEDNLLMLEIIQKGIKENQISFPVEHSKKINDDITFLELIKECVIPNLPENNCRYNVGEPISPNISSEIRKQDGDIVWLYPRQQVVAQGLVNAIQAGENSLILQGGTGLGKTWISSKVSHSIMDEIIKKDSVRILLFVQGHLIRKWQRQLQEAMPNVKINFKVLYGLSDLKHIEEKPQGIEVLILPKDRVKRNYQVEFVANKKHCNTDLQMIFDFAERLESPKRESIILRSIEDIPEVYAKMLSLRIEKVKSKPVVLYKEQLDINNKVKAYKIYTSSKKIRSIYGKSNKAYDFVLTIAEFKEFKKKIKDLRLELEQESEEKYAYRPKIESGLTCPHCGSLLYNKDNLFDSENHLDTMRKKPSDKTSANCKCKGWVKVDGTSLLKHEIEQIRRGFVKVVYEDANSMEQKGNNKNPYLDEDDMPLSNEDIMKVKSDRYNNSYKIRVKKCGHKLWGAVDKKGYRTVNIAQMLLKRFGKGSFDISISDEVHQFLRESAQGQTFGYICDLSKYRIALTGTLTGGKASDIYYLLWRMIPHRMVQMGYKYENVSLFIDHYGRRQKITKEDLSNDKYNKSGLGRKSSTGWTEAPGISPLLYTNFLQSIMVSRRMEDLGVPMPKVRYFKVPVDLSDELSSGYNDLKSQILSFAKENEVSVGGSYINSLLSYIDNPDAEPIYWKGTDTMVAKPRCIKTEELLPKEEALMGVLRNEIAEGRKVLIYSIFSGTKGVSKRLMRIIQREFKAIEMTSKVPLEEREQWIDDVDREGYEIIVCHPKLVETGLDIVQFPTIYHYGLTYDSKLERQASARPCRFGQTKECRVYYSYYANTIQEDALKLVGSKKKYALQLEGVFDEDFLSVMGNMEEDGAGVLFKALQGKIVLKESELDVFGFENIRPSFGENDTKVTSSNEIIKSESLHENSYISTDNIARNSNRIKIEQKPMIELEEKYVLTQSDIDSMTKKVKKNLCVGQISLFDMVS